MAARGDQWSVLVPVKRLDLAKTRISVAAGDRAELALAMACDTVRAALAADEVGEVVVITNDHRAQRALSELGARVVDDVPDAGLNPALGYGASIAGGEPVAALSSDLPALRPADLDAVLRQARDHPLAMVSDAEGSGTTLLAARTKADLVPHFGSESKAAHVRAGAIDLTGFAAASVRQDVDTIEALAAAVALGVGPDTTAALP